MPEQTYEVDERLQPITLVIAETIAKSRYTAWDSHAVGAEAMPWEVYAETDPQTAVGIYREDGLRDAVTLLPAVVRYVGSHASSAYAGIVEALQHGIDAATLLDQCERMRQWWEHAAVNGQLAPFPDEAAAGAARTGQVVEGALA